MPVIRRYPSAERILPPGNTQFHALQVRRGVRVYRGVLLLELGARAVHWRCMTTIRVAFCAPVLPGPVVGQWGRWELTRPMLLRQLAPSHIEGE